MCRGGLLEIEVLQAHWVKTFIYQVVNFYLGFGLSGGGQGGLGEGARENSKQERDLSEGVKREQKLEKHSFFVYNCV